MAASPGPPSVRCPPCLSLPGLSPGIPVLVPSPGSGLEGGVQGGGLSRTGQEGGVGPVVGAGEHSLGRNPTLRCGPGLEQPWAGGLRRAGCFSDLLPGLNPGQACAKTSASGAAPFQRFSAAPRPQGGSRSPWSSPGGGGSCAHKETELSRLLRPEPCPHSPPFTAPPVPPS